MRSFFDIIIIDSSAEISIFFLIIRYRIQLFLFEPYIF